MIKGSLIKDKNKIVIWSIFVYAIVINVYLYVHILHNFPHLLNDFESPYLSIAENLYKHGEYSSCYSEDCAPSTSVLPVAPIIGYLVFLIFGVGSTALEVLRIILMLSNFGIIIIAYYIGKIFNYRIGCAAAFLAASDLSMFCWANNFKSDMLYAFLSALSIYFLVRFVKCKQSKKNIILASLFLGLSVLTKSGLCLLFYPMAVFLLVFLLFIKKESFIKSLYYVSLFVVIQIVFIMGWQMRNYHATGVNSYLSSKLGPVVMNSQVAGLIAYQEGISRNEARKIVSKKYITKDIMKLDIHERNEYFENIAFKIVLNSPLDYAVATLINSGSLFLGTTPPDFLFSKKKREELYEILQLPLYDYIIRNDESSLPMLSKRVPKYMGGLSSFPLLKKLWNRDHYTFIFLWSIIKSHILLIYLMTIIGSFLILKDKSDRWVLILMVLIIVYYVAVLGVGPTASRIRCALMPIFYFLSSYGLVWVGEVLQEYKKRRSRNEKVSEI